MTQSLLFAMLITSLLASRVDAQPESLLAERIELKGPTHASFMPSLIWARPHATDTTYTDVVTGTSATLLRYDDYSATTDRYDGRYGIDDRGEVVAQLNDFQLDLAPHGDQFRLRLECQGFLAVDLTSEAGLDLRKLDVRSSGVVLPTGRDVRGSFYNPPAETLWIGNVSLDSDAPGAFRVLLENADFTIHASETRSFAATDERLVDPTVTHHVWYVLDVAQGSFHAASMDGTHQLWTPKVALESQGPAIITQAGAQESRRLEGPFDADIVPVKVRSDGLYALRLDYAPAEGPSQATAASVAAPVGGSWWMPVASVMGAVVAAGAGAVAWRRHHAYETRPATASAPAAAPAPTAAAPQGADAIEDAYRKEPGNLALAVELGLTYARAGRHEEALPLLLMGIQAFPKVEAVRYEAALALLKLGRDAEALRHLEYAFRLNPMNVARFLKEGPAHEHGRKPEVSALLHRWSRTFNETAHRGYA